MITFENAIIIIITIITVCLIFALFTMCVLYSQPECLAWASAQLHCQCNVKESKVIIPPQPITRRPSEEWENIQSSSNTSFAASRGNSVATHRTRIQSRLSTQMYKQVFSFYELICIDHNKLISFTTIRYRSLQLTRGLTIYFNQSQLLDNLQYLITRYWE